MERKATTPSPVIEAAWMIFATLIVAHHQLFSEDVLIASNLLCYAGFGVAWVILQGEHEHQYDFASKLSIIGYVGLWWTGVLGLAIAGHYIGLWEIGFPKVSMVAVVLLALAVYRRRKTYSSWKRGYGSSVKYRMKH